MAHPTEPSIIMNDIQLRCYPNNRFGSEKRRSRKDVFKTQTLPNTFRRQSGNINNCSIRQADIIRYFPSKEINLEMQNTQEELQPRLHFHNVFTPVVHSTPMYKFKSNLNKYPKNSSTSFSVRKPNLLSSGRVNSAASFDDYEMFKSCERSNVPSISHKVDMERNSPNNVNNGTSAKEKEGTIMKRRGIRGVSWVFNLALKDTSVGKVYRIQIAWIILILIVVSLIASLLLSFSGSLPKFHFTFFTNVSNDTLSSVSRNDSTENEIEMTTADDSQYEHTNQAILLRNLLSQNTSLELEITTTLAKPSQEKETAREKRIIVYKTENLILGREIVTTSLMIEDEDKSLNYCSSCRNKLDVCLSQADSGIPECKPASDLTDPTGCGGLCALEIEACHLLNRKHLIYTCRPVENMQYCQPNEWRCKNFLCIPKEKLCDGQFNCYDRSDETECPCDLSNNFQCGNNTSCLSNEKRCNGIIDCWDGEDEIDCTTTCPGDQFTCNNGDCISRSVFCDGFPDCRDESDEPDGCRDACTKHEYRCSNGRCISKLKQCNGLDDCGDVSDELSCTNITTTAS